jgi:probable biosynthetic protein (TIGR04098 family)
MLVEDIDLTIRTSGLRPLDEVTLLKLFADAQARHLMRGCSHSLSDITDVQGRALYPAYYKTHVRVSPSCPLDSFPAWSRLSIAAHVQSFGGSVLDSMYLAAPHGQVPEDPARWTESGFPQMSSGSMFIIDDRTNDVGASVPKAGMVAELPKCVRQPVALAEFREVRARGTAHPDFAATLTSNVPIAYPLVVGRDAAAGCNLLFAVFTQVMDIAEREHLTRAIWPRIPGELFDYARLLERVTYYFGNTQAGRTLLIDVRSRLHRCETDYHGDARHVVSMGRVESALEVYEAETSNLLVSCHANKLLLIPNLEQRLLWDAQRIFAAHGDRTTGVVEGAL